MVEWKNRENENKWIREIDGVEEKEGLRGTHRRWRERE